MAIGAVRLFPQTVIGERMHEFKTVRAARCFSGRPLLDDGVANVTILRNDLILAGGVSPVVTTETTVGP